MIKSAFITNISTNSTLNIKSMVLEIRDIYQTCHLPHNNTMARIVNEERRQDTLMR